MTHQFFCLFGIAESDGEHESWVLVLALLLSRLLSFAGYASAGFQVRSTFEEQHECHAKHDAVTMDSQVVEQI